VSPLNCRWTEVLALLSTRPPSAVRATQRTDFKSGSFRPGAGTGTGCSGPAHGGWPVSPRGATEAAPTE